MEHQRVHCREVGAWNRVAVETFGDIEIGSSTALFDGRLARRDWPGLRLARVASSPAVVCGARRGGAAGWFLFFNERGPCTLHQAGREAQLRDGEVTLVRADEPFDIRFEQRNQLFVVGLAEAFGSAALEARLMQRHGRDEAAVLGALLRRLAVLDEAAAAQLEAPAVPRAVLDLLALARPTAAVSVPEQLLARLEARVQRALSDPALDVHHLADEIGASARSVQRLFAQYRGTSPGAFILEQRLQRAALVLREQAGISVTEVALEAGFGDLSYFCRSFRGRFGVAPGRWRRLA